MLRNAGSILHVRGDAAPCAGTFCVLARVKHAGPCEVCMHTAAWCLCPTAAVPAASPAPLLLAGLSPAARRYEVGIRRGHHLVATGPYLLLLHPSYTGTVLLVAGFYYFLGGHSNWFRRPLGLALLAAVGGVVAGGRAWCCLVARRECWVVSAALGACLEQGAACPHAIRHNYCFHILGNLPHLQQFPLLLQPCALQMRRRCWLSTLALPGSSTAPPAGA